jgi:hypothetical protein
MLNGEPFMILRALISALALTIWGVASVGQSGPPAPQSGSTLEFEYRLLPPDRVAKMEKAMNEAAADGFSFADALGDGLAPIIVMSRRIGAPPRQRYEYRLMITSNTTTMATNLQLAGDEGYEHKAEATFKKTFGFEVAMIMERDKDAQPVSWEYKLLTTRKLSTMQKEILAAAAEGFQFVSFGRSETFFSSQLLAIMRRRRH